MQILQQLIGLLDMYSLDEVRLLGVKTELLECCLTEVVPMLKKALVYARNRHTVERVIEDLRKREMQLWIAIQNIKILGFAITKIDYTPATNYKVAYIMFIGGTKMHKWIHLTKYIIEWARQNGCDAVEGYGRDGWERVFKRYGLKKIQTVFSIALK